MFANLMKKVAGRRYICSSSFNSSRRRRVLTLEAFGGIESLEPRALLTDLLSGTAAIAPPMPATAPMPVSDPTSVPTANPGAGDSTLLAYGGNPFQPQTMGATPPDSGVPATPEPWVNYNPGTSNPAVMSTTVTPLPGLIVYTGSGGYTTNYTSTTSTAVYANGNASVSTIVQSGANPPISVSTVSYSASLGAYSTTYTSTDPITGGTTTVSTGPAIYYGPGYTDLTISVTVPWVASFPQLGGYTEFITVIMDANGDQVDIIGSTPPPAPAPTAIF